MILPEYVEKYNEQLKHCADISAELDSQMNQIESDVFMQQDKNDSLGG